jgi:PAS domain S-box-containing protein
MIRVFREMWKRRAAAENQSQRAFLERVLNTLVTPVFVEDRSHRFIMVNDALCVLTGRTRFELIGRSDYDFFPRAEAEEFVTKDELVFTTQKPGAPSEAGRGR